MAARKHALGLVVGARPNFIKAAPLLARLRSRPDFSVRLIHTGQHFDDNMSRIFFEQLGMHEPDHVLAAGHHQHAQRLGGMMDGLKRVLDRERFDTVVVFGDVNSALAGATAAASVGSRLVHVEAGLRSFDRRMPEESNRIVIDHLSDVLFTTEESANANLRDEGISDDRVAFVGNLMIEALIQSWDAIQASTVLDHLGLRDRRYVVVTIHRQENTDSKDLLERILRLVRALTDDAEVVFPMHPGTVRKIDAYGLTALLDGVRVIDPLGYLDFVRLVQASAGVVSDSGGIQEEASHLGVPCCTLRDNTERPVTLSHGTNRLFPLRDVTIDGLKAHLSGPPQGRGPIPLWDADVSERIVARLTKDL